MKVKAAIATFIVAASLEGSMAKTCQEWCQDVPTMHTYCCQDTSCQITCKADGTQFVGLDVGSDAHRARQLSFFDDLGNGLKDGVESIFGGVTKTVEKSACDVIKGMNIKIPGLREMAPDESYLSGLVKFSGAEASTGDLKLSECSVENGKATLGFHAEAKLEGGDVSLAGKAYDLPSASVPYSVTLSANVCSKIPSIPTGINDFKVGSIKVGDATVADHKIPPEVATFINNSAGKFATDAVNSLAAKTISDKSFGLC